MARRNIIPLFIPNLGCPNHCVFCDQRRISGSPLPVSGRDVSAALDRAKIAGLQDLELAFYGGSFTAVDASLQEELLDKVRPYRDDGVVSAVRLSTRPDAINEAVIRRLTRYHVDTVELGAQSMDDGVLCASGRGHSVADTETAVGLLKNAGFSLVLQMMTGLPGSNAEKDVDTARRIIALDPDGVRIYPTVIVKDTPLEKMWRMGLYHEHTVEDAVAVCADILPLFQAADIPVIRLGLNPTEELSNGAAVGGAYHPALGELVRSEVLRRQAARLLKNIPAGAFITLGVAPSQVSIMTGQHRSNIAALTAEFRLAGLKIQPVEGLADQVIYIDGKE